MRYMWDKEVLPRLQQRPSGAVLISRTIKTFALAEALVDELVAPLLSSPNPTLGIYARPDGIHLRLAAKAPCREEAEKMLAQAEARLRELLGEDHIWGVDDDTLESMIGELLTARGLTVATMESCTGGLLATTLNNAPNSSSYYKGGIVACSPEAQISFGVEAQLVELEGTVSPKVAEAMAKAARSRFGADIGVGITGVAGPEEIEGKPVGVVHIAVADEKRKRLLRGIYPPQPQEVRQRATIAALFGIRQLLLSAD
jgi:nicotinamide-nucleotide amidase